GGLNASFLSLANPPNRPQPSQKTASNGGNVATHPPRGRQRQTNEVWYDAARRMDRFAAADLLREVCAERFGSVEQAVAAGLALRYDGGSCFRSDHYQAEINHLGIARSPAFHYEPETNGCAEKAIQTLKEQLLWIERFETLEDLRQAVRRFGHTYNKQWLIER